MVEIPIEWDDDDAVTAVMPDPDAPTTPYLPWDLEELWVEE